MMCHCPTDNDGTPDCINDECCCPHAPGECGCEFEGEST